MYTLQIFYFIRSAEAGLPVANTADPREADIQRMLTMDGFLDQAPARRQDINGVEFCAAFSSPARRSTQTANIVTGNPSIVTQIDELYTPAGYLGDLYKELYEAHGNASLRTYFDDPAGYCVENFGIDAWAAIKQSVNKRDGEFAVFGHAPSLQAVMYAMLKQRQKDFREKVLDIVLEPTGMVKVTVENSTVMLIETVS